MPRSGWRGAPSRRGAAAYGVAYLLSGRQFSLQKCDFVFCGKGEKSPVASKYCGKPLRGCVGSRSAAGAAAPRLVGARIQCILKNADFPTWGPSALAFASPLPLPFSPILITRKGAPRAKIGSDVSSQTRVSV